MIDFEKLKIKDYKHWEVYLFSNQYYLGRLFLWAKRKNAIDFLEMTKDEKEEFFKLAKKIKKTLRGLFKPDLMNYASLGNVMTHLHVHFIPRYKKPRTLYDIDFVDENWGRNYAPYNKSFRLPEDILFKLRDKIKKKLET